MQTGSRRTARAFLLCLCVCAAFAAHGHAGHHASPSAGENIPSAAGGQGQSSQGLTDPAATIPPEGVTATGCWIRALPNRLPAAAYFSLHNQGAREVELVGASSQGFGSVMLHANQEDKGMATMVHVDRVSIGAGQRFDFAPGGHHVMLQKPMVDLRVGSQHVITLHFKDDRALTVTCDVRPAGASSSGKGS